MLLVSQVLVLTKESDTTADMVIEALVERGAEVTQLDTGDFGQR